MEYVSIVTINGYELKNIGDLNQLGQQFGFELISDINFNYDREIKDGLFSFFESVDGKDSIVIKKKNYKNKVRIKKISEDLSSFYLEESDSDFLNFLNCIRTHLPNEFYLLFAFEWHKEDRVRFMKMKLEMLRDYFKKHNGWYLWLYDYKKNVELPNLDVPLIIKVENM